MIPLCFYFFFFFSFTPISGPPFLLLPPVDRKSCNCHLSILSPSLAGSWCFCCCFYLWRLSFLSRFPPCTFRHRLGISSPLLFGFALLRFLIILLCFLVLGFLCFRRFECYAFFHFTPLFPFCLCSSSCSPLLTIFVLYHYPFLPSF